MPGEDDDHFTKRLEEYLQKALREAKTETTWAELKERINRTIAYLNTIPADKIDGSEDRKTVVKVNGKEVDFTCQDFLTQRAIPNFFFHVTTAYDVLRHAGVPIGKMDYLGKF